MKVSCILSIGMCLFLFSANSMASTPNMSEVILCSLPGSMSREVSFAIDNGTREIKYEFKRNGKAELNVLFNEGNKLKRLVDSKMGVTYYGFKRGQYSYVLDVINGAEKEEYTMSFDIKKNNKIVQSSDCLPSSFRSDNIKSEFITDVPFIDGDEFIFP